MKAASEPSHRQLDEDGRQMASSDGVATHASEDQPLPGVMDFIGAHVGGELAEERWR